MQPENPDFTAIILVGALIVLGPFVAIKFLAPMSRGSDGIPIVILFMVALVAVLLFRS